MYETLLVMGCFRSGCRCIHRARDAVSVHTYTRGRLPSVVFYERHVLFTINDYQCSIDMGGLIPGSPRKTGSAPARFLSIRQDGRISATNHIEVLAHTSLRSINYTMDRAETAGVGDTLYSFTPLRFSMLSYVW